MLKGGETAQSSSVWLKSALVASVLLLTGFKIFSQLETSNDVVTNVQEFIPYCRDNYEPLAPKVSSKFLNKIDKILNNKEFKDDVAAKLSGAVQIPTVIGDVFPNPKDDLEFYSEFFKLHDYLEKTFPLVHKHFKKEKVNEVGLLYTWEGSDSSLKPVLFMAHQDEVLVNPETVGDWKHPPFSGYYDGESVWGRGSADCKTTLIGELVAMEELLRDGFQPQRTIILLFGFDEESGGEIGARTLSQFVEERYGTDSIFTIMDEGAGVVEVESGLYAAVPITQERGFGNIEITISGPGGHSSVPPKHTNVGILSELVYTLENNSFDYVIEDTHPFLSYYQCVAEFSNKIDPGFRHIIKKAATSYKYRLEFVKALEVFDPLSALTFKTTESIDMFHSGVKVNALPETGSLEINYRIGMHSNAKEVLERTAGITNKIAQNHGYNLTIDGDRVIYSDPQNVGTLNLKMYTYKDPSPRSPSYQDNDKVWDLFAGTIRDYFENRVLSKDEPSKLFITTGTMTANTDTRHLWNLTSHIYRFQGAIFPIELFDIVHSVNEHSPVANVLQLAGFIYQYVLNADGADVGF
ncbi:M20 family metallopeptidase [Kluyveromyces lactis]|uniref:KLLA0F01903p n=1 Tax=Kluyveromyces lactis (strain ATCC 8585 / CBS 2359 / DSM 70799 / NBRC 1267 / NRRL Y-1140 / WM37) TaxID=284590 RepID=Q6CLM3_KLULA|nr:uncharacterized protein KLLA0_F01903g [Kluyveromyces lactis]CAG97873.1 KLLA0F01903p [Kluyveromyces lactis]|eukprot:XP_455166.1 uncharacterized protein KLLA0_F01903g [Kluyveromyces lactis]